MSKNIRKIQGMWIWTLFLCLTNLNWVNRNKCAYGFNSNSNLKHICKWLCIWLLLNWIVPTLWPRTSPLQYWSCVWALQLNYPLFVVCSIDVQPEPEATPFIEDPVMETSSARQAAPPLIMSIKTHFPLYLLCMNRMITLMSILTA